MQRKVIADLFNILENSGFKDTGGPLKKCVDFKIIKDLLYDRLLEPIPQIYIKKYQLDKGELPNDTAIDLDEEKAED